MVLPHAHVKLKAPLTIPFNVPEPAPPTVLLLPKVMALLKISLVPVKVKAPFLPTPTAFNVMQFLSLHDALPISISSVAPDVTLVLVVLPNPVAAPILNVPALTVVVPL